jgi:hypothetical protein
VADCVLQIGNPVRSAKTSQLGPALAGSLFSIARGKLQHGLMQLKQKNGGFKVAPLCLDEPGMENQR